MNAVSIILIVFFALVLLTFAVGSFIMFFFSVVRERKGKRQIDYWQPGTENTGKYLLQLNDDSRNTIVNGMLRLREKAAEKVYINSRDGLKLCARVVENENAKGVAVLFHGYRSSGAFDFAPSAADIEAKGFTLLIPDLRGHGESEGDYVTFGVLDRYDAVDWAKYAAERWGKPVVVFGISMGASTVMMGADVGYPSEVKAIVADCGFTSVGDICKRCMKQWYRLPPFPLYYGAKLLVKLFAKYDFDSVSARKSLEKLRGKGMKVLIVHGKKDNFVPCSMSVENFKAFDYMPESVRREAAEMFLVEEAVHGASFLVDREGYLEAFDRLLTKAGI